MSQRVDTIVYCGSKCAMAILSMDEPQTGLTSSSSTFTRVAFFNITLGKAYQLAHTSYSTDSTMMNTDDPRIEVSF